MIRFLPLLLLAGCPKGGDTAPNAFPAPKEIRWTENVSFEGFPAVTVAVRQTWTPSARQNGHPTWEVVELQTDKNGEHERTRTRIYLDETGFGYLSATDKDATWQGYVPPEQVLPAKAEIGATWHEVHTRASQTIDRTCEIKASSWCAGGVVSVCDGKSGDTRRIFRDHFCPGVGWSGFEAMQAGPQGKVRIWSTDVTVDGNPAPAPKDPAIPG